MRGRASEGNRLGGWLDHGTAPASSRLSITHVHDITIIICIHHIPCAHSSSVPLCYIAFENRMISSQPPREQMNGGPSPSSRGRSSGMTHFISSLYFISAVQSSNYQRQAESIALSTEEIFHLGLVCDIHSDSRIGTWAVRRCRHASQRCRTDVSCSAVDCLISNQHSAAYSQWFGFRGGNGELCSVLLFPGMPCPAQLKLPVLQVVAQHLAPTLESSSSSEHMLTRLHLGPPLV